MFYLLFIMLRKLPTSFHSFFLQYRWQNKVEVCSNVTAAALSCWQGCTLSLLLALTQQHKVTHRCFLD